MKAIFWMICILSSICMAYAQPFGPPIYIGNPNSLECRYYFAGDERHFNPRPDNYSENIGYTTDFKSQEQACEFFRCVFTNGTVKVNAQNEIFESNLCICSGSQIWNNASGCIEIKDLKEEAAKENGFFEKVWNWIKELFS